jgi:hypothetical protein
MTGFGQTALQTSWPVLQITVERGCSWSAVCQEPQRPLGTMVRTLLPLSGIAGLPEPWGSGTDP